MSARDRRTAFDGLSWLYVLTAAFVSGCGGGGGGPSGPPPERGDLAEGLAARVGREDVTAVSVLRISKAQGVEATTARDHAIRDALFASEARASGLAEEPEVEGEVRGVLARRLLLQLLDEADRMGPVSDAELEEVTKRRWLELDRPEGFRTVHAVVRVPANASAEVRARAEVVAKAIQAAVAKAADVARTKGRPAPLRPNDEIIDPAAEAFRLEAQAVSHDGLEVTIETLTPVSADGRLVASNGGALEVAFAKGAAQLAARGDVSALVTTSYGVHVIMLLERTPSSIVPVEERRRLVRDEVLWSRASALRMKLLQSLRRDVSVEPTAEALVALVPIER